MCTPKDVKRSTHVCIFIFGTSIMTMTSILKILWKYFKYKLSCIFKIIFVNLNYGSKTSSISFFTKGWCRHTKLFKMYIFSGQIKKTTCRNVNFRPVLLFCIWRHLSANTNEVQISSHILLSLLFYFIGLGDNASKKYGSWNFDSLVSGVSVTLTKSDQSWVSGQSMHLGVQTLGILGEWVQFEPILKYQKMTDFNCGPQQCPQTWGCNSVSRVPCTEQIFWSNTNKHIN